ncbi:MAG: 1-deoxy-D-xylulose-5-phosphate reductoisomerase [Rhodocyclaceae bacterium]|nr:MAG: 1-deoxy-D-xylulose-5-phosphate reductoisomerase [Rhodocyclaceae bacterium]
MVRQRLTVLGATGSIGVSTLDVVARHSDCFDIVALTGHQRIDQLAAQCKAHRPRFAVAGTLAGAQELTQRLGAEAEGITILHGPEALVTVAAMAETDTVMAAIVGAAGLPPTLAAASAGKRILLANKEALVMAGPVFMAEVHRSGAVLLPIDSEHNAIFQSLPSQYDGDMARSGVRRILLTASGGPFRTTPLADLSAVTPEQACAHPKWVMGRKISVDSATMMNKGLEVIEAHWLFNAAADDIQVVIHPQSVIHSLVQYVDGSVLAQLGNPDMRTPIAHALAYPERMESGVASLDLFQVAQLNFEKPDFARFPCLALAYQALRSGGNAPAVLNAANEEAVAAFLDRRLAFMAISDVVARTLAAIPFQPVTDLPAVLQADLAAREFARKTIEAAEHPAAA